MIWNYGLKNRRTLAAINKMLREAIKFRKVNENEEHGVSVTNRSMGFKGNCSGFIIIKEVFNLAEMSPHFYDLLSSQLTYRFTFFSVENPHFLSDLVTYICIAASILGNCYILYVQLLSRLIRLEKTQQLKIQDLVNMPYYLHTYLFVYW